MANDCANLVGEVVDPNGSDSCQFSVSYVDRNAGDQIDDVVTASVEDAFGQTGSASDDELVTVDDVAPTVVVEKQNIAVGGTNEIVAPGGLATYSIEIRNPDTAVEPFTITSVIDTISTTGSGFGPTVIDYFTIGGPVVATDCIDYVDTVLAPGESVTCEFTIDTRLLGTGVVAAGDVITNRVDVDVVDDDGTTDHGFDDADRDVVAEPPQLVVDKTDHDVDILEAADDIAYDITITNISVTVPLTINSIIDAVTFVPAGGAAESRGVLVVDGNGIDASGLIGVEPCLHGLRRHDRHDARARRLGRVHDHPPLHGQRRRPVRGQGHRRRRSTTSISTSPPPTRPTHRSSTLPPTSRSSTPRCRPRCRRPAVRSSTR